MTPISRVSHRCLVGQSERIAKNDTGGIGGGKVIRGVLAVALFFFSTTLTAITACDFNWTMPANVTRVVAGDVLEVEVQGFDSHQRRLRVYLARAQCANKAKATEARKYTENTLLGKAVRLAIVAMVPKATLVEVFYDMDLKNLSDVLISEGLAIKGRAD
jgi:endonuclease YncB( thermonuclease family)